MLLNGLEIVPHPLATQTKVEFQVVRWSQRRKRRKNWTVQRREYQVPCVYQIGNLIYMHPDLFDKLKGGTA